MMLTNKRRQLDNAGYSLVTVIVVIVFVSVLATLVLFAAGRNVQAKSSNRKNIETFYGAETALEELKVALTERLSELCAGTTGHFTDGAYATFLEDYASTTGGDRTKKFRTKIVSAYKQAWEDDAAAAGGYVQLIESLLSAEYAGCISADTVGTMTANATDGYVTLKNVVVEFTNTEGYTSSIKTDFIISCPEIDFSMDMAVMESDAPDVSREKISLGDCVKYSKWERD